MGRIFAAAIALGVVAAGFSCRKPLPTAPDREAIASTVSAFHEALMRDDRDAALALLTLDAQILETGHRQSREEYAAEHLAADIEFARAVSSSWGALIVRQEGDVAWTSVTSRNTGEFRGKNTDAEGAELMVLARTENGWRIRTIHWSSHSGSGH